MRPLFGTIWTWVKRAALFGVIVGVAYNVAQLFPHWNDSGGMAMRGSPLVFASTLAAELALLYFWRRRDEGK